MENVHKTATRPWISKLINVRKFLDDSVNVLETQNKLSSDSKELLSSERYEEIQTQCSIEALRCPLQQCIEIGRDVAVPNYVNLETVRLQINDLEKQRTNTQYEAIVYNNAKCNNYPLEQNIVATGISENKTFVPIQQPEVILTVQIFRPEKRSHGIRNVNTRFPIFHIDQEFMVLGCQYLTELRDIIDCVSDRAIPGDFSENPNMPVEVTCKDLYKSGFFYINGVFYNDMRHPDCRDYSEIIINWASNEQRKVGPFRKSKMENVKFIDLELQMGYPYVYVHQGNCEHFVVFSDLRMHSHYDKKNRNEYPLYVELKQKKRVFCMVCHLHTAEWIVYNSKRVPETPFWFCKSCFFSFNYDENNQKIGDFEAYHHIDRSNIL